MPVAQLFAEDLSTSTRVSRPLATGRYPLVSPDGRWLAYAKAARCGDAATLAVRDVVSGAEREWAMPVPTDGDPYELRSPQAWSSDSRHLVITVNRSVTSTSFWEVDTAMAPGTLDASAVVKLGGSSDPNGPGALVTASAPDHFTALGINGRIVDWAVPGGDVGTLLQMPATPGIRIAGVDATGRHLLILAGGGASGDTLYRWTVGDAAPTKLAEGIVAADW